jgi:hypothetical protein
MQTSGADNMWSAAGQGQQKLQSFDLVQVKGRSANGAASAAIIMLHIDAGAQFIPHSVAVAAATASVCGGFCCEAEMPQLARSGCPPCH